MSDARKKDAGADATHFVVAVPAGPFAAGAVVAREELHEALGADPKAKEEAVAATRAGRVKRLLEMGVIAPTEAPPSPEEVAEREAKEAEERRKAGEEAARKPAHAHAEKPEEPRPAPKR
jgi:hypothetical protein